MAKNVCSFGIDLQFGKSLKGLANKYGTNSKALAICTVCIDNLNEEANYIPTEGFKEYWEKNAPKNTKLDFQKTSPDVLTKLMENYYNTIDRNVEHTTFSSHINGIVGTYGYESEVVRQEGINLTISYMLDLASGYANNPQRRARLDAFIKNNPKVNVRSWKFFCSQATGNVLRELMQRIAVNQNKELSEIIKDLKGKETDIEYIKTQLGELTQQDKNLLALYFEMTSNSNYFEEVKNNSKLGDLRNNVVYSKDDDIQADFNELEEDIAEDAVKQLEDDTDDYMKQIASKGETATSWVKLIPDNITNYFNSLKRLQSIGKNGTDLDRNNAYGIPYTMDAPTCISVLLSRCNFYNPDSMVDDIEKIASQLPGFEAFINFAKDLRANPDFKMSVYHFCARALTSKVEVQLRNNGYTVKQSNDTVDRRTRFLYDIQNDIRNNALNLDYYTVKSDYNNLSSAIKTANDIFKTGDNILIEKAKNDLVEEIYKFTRLISPSITPAAIRAYCENKENNNKSGNQFVNNANILVDNLVKYSEGIKTSQDNDRINITNIKEAKEHNKKLSNDGKVHDASEYKDVNALYKVDFISNELNSIAQFLAEQLLDYSVVKIDLNGRNSEGKNVSNLTDVSFTSILKKVLSNDESLTNFGKFRFQSMQYKFSNIMVEQTDEKGQVITKGLFRKVGNDYVPTEYAKDLLQINLFDGATNTSTEEAVLYRNMSKGDFVGTAFRMFVNAANEAQYFMRIPSDAPKIFTVKAPKISVAGLIEIENQNEIDDEINRRIKALPTVEYSSTLDNAVRINNSSTLANHIFNKNKNIQVKAKAGKDKTILYNYKTKYANVYYLIRGDVDSNGVMSNPTFVGFVNTDKESNRITEEVTNALKNSIKKDIETNGWTDEQGRKHNIIRTINTNHRIFKVFKNTVMQELHEMGIALNAMFVTDDNGIPIRDKDSGKLVWRDGWLTKEDRIKKGFNNYHFKGDDVVVTKNGREVLTGNVFKTTKFNYFDLTSDDADEAGVVDYIQSAVEPFIDFLYGGANTIKFTKEGGKVTDVILNSNQSSTIDKALSNFIINYVNDFTKRIAPNEEFISDKHYNDESIAEFALNTRLVYYMFDDLFEGNSKFYGDGQNLLKRAKETQMGGTPYGSADYLMDYTIKEKQHVNSILDDESVKATLQHKQIVDGVEVSTPVEIELYDRFNAVIIPNTIRHNEESLIALRNELINTGTDEAVADKIIDGYRNTKANDAQSYITFEEWIRRITARGQFTEYRPLIEAIYDETKPLDAQAIGKFIQVQKNVYYDLGYDSTTGVIAPRQIKNSEFVLIPRLIKGTELELLYNSMRRNNIDQINTSETVKAAKHQEIEFWDRQGNLTQEQIDKFDNAVSQSGAIENYFYTNLFTQLETPHHLNAENKAGIQIMKKILDNIDSLPEGNPLHTYKKNIIDNFCANIQDSFDELMDECGAVRNENGTLKITDKGTVEGLKFKVFLDKLKQELLRLGLDSNSIDYITQVDEEANNGVTIMPIYMGNFGKKLQNIANAVFNQAITRQKLPGFHAVQVTQIGWNKANGEKPNVKYSSKLKYHPNGERYIEVALPASNFGLNKNDKRWMDKYNQYISEGKTSEEADELVKQDMLKELSDSGLDTLIGYRIPTEGKQSICIMKVVDFIDDAYGSTIVVPDEWVAQTGSDFDVDSIYGIQYTSRNGIDKPLKKYTTLSDDSIYDAYKSLVLSKVTPEEKDILIKNADITIEDVKDGMTTADAKNDFIEALNEYGVKYGVGTLEEFKNNRKEYERKHRRDIRNNIIVDNMINILKSDEMLEENLGRSNFEDIIEALNTVGNSTFKKERSARTGYDFLNQASYQEDAMGGAKLKAFSVTRDTFCSVCNTVRPNLTKAINIVYPKSMFTEAQLEKLKKRFDKVNITDKTVTILHNTLGWSNDDKNILGRIITSYSSQTTAHILDAIKEGAIPNVNDFTFAVYKLFPDIGSDYETAIAFMMQPAITEIVENYNKNKSIYADNFMSAIEKTKRDICKRLGKDDADYCPITDINKFIYNTIGKSDEITINKEALIRNLSVVPSDIQNLKTVLDFEELYNYTQDIQDIVRCLNPDKFGAKQTIYATRKVFDDALRLIGKGDVKGHPLLTKDNLSIIEAIYPNIRLGLEDFATLDGESAYPTLYTFLKYASAPSIIVNSNLFDTQHSAYVDKIKSVLSILSQDKGLSEKTYDALDKYALDTIYQKSKFIRGTVVVNDEGKLDVLVDDSDDTFLLECRRIYGYNKGTNYQVKDKDGQLVEFTINDIDNPTIDELNMFAQLSPAQKVSWVKANYDNAGLFDKLTVRLKDPNLIEKDGVNTQKIIFNNSSEDIETVLSQFDKIFNNSDKLIAMTALDLVKYAFIVEGFSIRQNGITRLIKNNAVYESFTMDVEKEQLGTGIVDDVKHNIKQFPDSDKIGDRYELYEKFIRSHQEISELPKAVVKKVGKNFELTRGGLFIISLPHSEETTEKLIKYNIVEQSDNNYEFTFNGKTYKYNKYVKLKFDDEYILHKIVTTPNGVYLLPLNPLLPNETTELSVKAEYNKYQPIGTLESTISIIESEGRAVNGSEISRIVREGKINVINYKAELNKENTELDFDIDTPPTGYTGAAQHIKDAVSKEFGDKIVGDLYIQNALLNEYLRAEGIANTVTKVITVTKPDGSTEKRKFDIYRVPKKVITRYNRDYLKVQGKGRDLSNLSPSLQNIITAHREDSDFGKDARPIVNLFVITPHIEMSTNVEETTEYASLFDDIETEITRTFKSDNIDAKQRYIDEGILNSTSINDKNKYDAIRVLSENIENQVNTLMARIFNFEDIGNLSSNEVLNAILSDEILRQKFLATILDVEDFREKHKTWLEFDTVGEDAEMSYFINKIKNSITKLTGEDLSRIINTAKEKFIEDYVSKQSTDPRVQQGLISIVNGFYKTTNSQLLFHDIQENNNTFLQTVLKISQSNIAAKDNMAPQYIKKFKSEINRLKKEAENAGLKFDWSHIINDKGKFTTDYNEKFVEDFNNYLNKINDAKNANDDVEVIKATLEFDEWKIKHLEQKVVTPFYEEKLNIEKAVFGVAPEEFAKYKRLRSRMSEIYNDATTSGNELTPEQEKELTDIRREIINMTSDNTYNFSTGEFSAKMGDDLTKARALNKYIADNKALYEEYYKNSAKYGFDELLSINLSIIRRKENPDSNGRPQTDMATLLADEEYLKAKQWLAEHAHLVPDAEVQEELNEAYKVLKIGKNLENTISKFVSGANAYDEYGNIDGTKLSDTQRKAIKDKMEEDYKKAVDSEDKRIINNAGVSSNIYLNSFYEGITAGGRKTAAYIEAVNAINAITKKYYNPSIKTVETFNMTTEDLQELKRLIDVLSSIRRNVVGSTTKASRDKANEFREKYTTTVYNLDEFRRQERFANEYRADKGFDWFALWQEVNGTIDNPNDVLYGRLEPKNEFIGKEKVNGKWVGKGSINFLDIAKMNALETIQTYTYTTPTKYWYDVNEEWVKKVNEAYRISDDAGKAMQEEYNKWYEDNTIYNPYARRREPIRCWTTLAYTPSAKLDYEAKWKETSSNPKDIYLNPKYRNNVSPKENYKRGDEKYDNKEINKYESEAREFVKAICEQLLRNKNNIRRLREGYAPARRKAQTADAKWFGKELGKAVGITLSYGRATNWTDDIDYGTFEAPSINMMEELQDKTLLNLGPTPVKRHTESEEDYVKRLTEYNDELKAKKELVHEALVDSSNWESVIEDFITEAVHYNAVQDEKEMLFFARDVLKNLRVHSKQYGFYGKFKGKTDERGKGTVYNDVPDKKVVEQLEVFMHRLLYDEWKKPQGKATTIAGLLQSFTTAKYMMLNLRGGVANISVGESQIIAESAAGQFFKGKDYIKAKWLYTKAVPSMINNMYSDKSTTLVDALIKFFNVIDYDEITFAAKTPDANEVSRRLRNLAFFQQSAGEHMMQNSALLAMLMSHKLINVTDKNGNNTLKLMTEAQYVRYREGNLLKTLLTDEQKAEYDNYIKDIENNDEAKRELVYLKDDINYRFARRYLKGDKNKLKEYVEKRNSLRKEYIKEFKSDAYQTLYDQFDLKDSMLAFKDGSVLQSMDTLEIKDFSHIFASDTQHILGRFKRKVISVNKKIHGVYDKLGAATIESEWYGSLVMQYHKHLYMGIQKRWKSSGSYSEEREEFEKGYYNSLLDFLATPYRDYKDSIAGETIDFMTSIQNIFKSYVEFLLNTPLNWSMMSDVDKANIRRACADLFTFTSAIFLMIGIRVAMDDDDDKLLNFCLYEADRLASETWMYNPLGLVTEAKTLYSSPIATQTIVSDALDTMNEISKILLEGDEYNGYYAHGRYAGQSKALVFTLRNIPIWRQYESLRDIDKSNSYYKIGTRGGGIINTKEIAESFK